jgi:adenosylmethionine-8-amino-7-oxononanoate aminotransferase
MSYADRDRRHLWHPFTQMSDWLKGHPLVIERAEGNTLIDTEGNRYLDGISSLWVNLHGHDHPKIRQALHEQLDRLAHSTLLGLASVPSIEAAEKLIAIAPAGLTRVFFSDNGSTAVEIAIKMAFQFWQQQRDPALRRKTRFVALKNGYHGDTLGAVSMGGVDVFHQIFGPLCFPVHRAENAFCYRCPYGLRYPDCGIHCLESMEGILENHAQEIAAVVVEPIMQGAAGMLTLPDGWLRRVRELCNRHEVLLIADEVATGFGRTGRMFACEHEGVSPDLLAVAKGITGGYLPLAATLATEQIFARPRLPRSRSSRGSSVRWRRLDSSSMATPTPETPSVALPRWRTWRSSRRRTCSRGSRRGPLDSRCGSRASVTSPSSGISVNAGSWRGWSSFGTVRPASRSTPRNGWATTSAWRFANGG